MTCSAPRFLYNGIKGQRKYRKRRIKNPWSSESNTRKIRHSTTEGRKNLSDAKISQFANSAFPGFETISNIQLQSSDHPILKGHGFSRAAAFGKHAALAAEGSPFIASRVSRVPHGIPYEGSESSVDNLGMEMSQK